MNKALNIDVFEYTCYRTFLCDYAEQKRLASSHWSYGSWAKNLGLSGTASLTMILGGQRNAGQSITEKFIKYFKFDQEQSQYFQDLIKLEKAQNDPGLYIILLEKLNKQSPNKNFTRVGADEFRVISKWYYYALREMIHLKDFKEDPDWIASRLNFKVTASEIKKAIEDLLSLGLLKRSEKGELSCSYASLDTENEVSNEYLKRFHEQMISHAKTSIRSIPLEKRSINGMTLTLNQEDIPKAKELINKFQDDLCELMEKKQGNATYQCNIQLFPLVGAKEI